MIEINNLKVKYGDVVALRNVSMSIKKGEIVSIVGANGAGKSTLINTISGFSKPVEGEIRFLGERIDILAPHLIAKRGLIQTPEGRGIFPFMTVMENLEMGAYLIRSKEKANERLNMILEFFPVLMEKRFKAGETLSGGEQQMLSIARGLMSQPKLMMLDEPSVGLSPLVIKVILDTVRRIHEEGTTVLLVDQNVHLALSIADRGYVLENGHITLEGKGCELLGNEHLKIAYLGM